MEQDIKIANNIGLIKHKIAVMSGKGGVGKSTIAVNLAHALSKKGYKTGILDADLHGPNIPKMLDIEGSNLKIGENGFLPIKTLDGIEVVSMQFLLPSEDTPIIWRGPKKTGVIREFLSNVYWGKLDFLIVDNPPGTGDEPLTVLQSIPQLDGVIIITTPHSVALEDVEKCINMARSLKIEVIGIIENMSSFICPNCHAEISIFGKGGGKIISQKMNIPFLGALPVDLNISESTDKGIPILNFDPTSEISKNIIKIVNIIEDEILRGD